MLPFMPILMFQTSIILFVFQSLLLEQPALSLLCQKAAISLLLQKRTQFVAPKSTVSTQALAPKSSTQVVVQKKPNNTASTDAKIITVSTQAVVPKTQKAQSALSLLRQNAKKHCQHSGGCAKKPKNTQPQRQRQGVRQDNRALNTDSLPGSWPFQPTTLRMITVGNYCGMHSTLNDC